MQIKLTKEEVGTVIAALEFEHDAYVDRVHGKVTVIGPEGKERALRLLIGQFENLQSTVEIARKLED